MRKSDPKKKHYVYVLRCVDGSLYTGYTTDIDKRLIEHNGEGGTVTARSAGARYTRGRRPVELVYYEKFATRSEATQREYKIKQLTRLAKEQLIKKVTKKSKARL